MTRTTFSLIACSVFLFSSLGAAQDQWAVHDRARPMPPVVAPGPAGPPVPPPADAIVLFDGQSLASWTDAKGQPAKWKVENGSMEVIPKTGDIRTVKGFGDCQLHVEWMAPAPAKGTGQDRGNSGVFFMNLYEVQVLDCFGNSTYADGMTAAIYGQFPPAVNACRPPGEWQSYDIIFRRPRFDESGKLLAPARMTVFHNGILVHECAVLTKPTRDEVPAYKMHADKLPLSLQDHDHPVRYRNIWLRELE